MTKPAKLTQAKVKAELKALGLTFKKTDWNDYRVAWPGGRACDEDSAHYTDDLEDALGTGRAMAKRAQAMHELG